MYYSVGQAIKSQSIFASFYLSNAMWYKPLFITKVDVKFALFYAIQSIYFITFAHLSRTTLMVQSNN